VLRTIVAVGKDVHDALSARAWVQGLALFRILHWSNVGVSHQKSLVAKHAAEERSFDEGTVEEYRAFMDERRIAMGKSPQQDLRIGDGAIRLLAVYRKQFGCIRKALADSAFQCERRVDVTCCRAVARLDRLILCGRGGWFAFSGGWS